MAKLEYPLLKSEADILAFAEKVERMAATSYLGDIGKLSIPALSKLMASILGVETTHIEVRVDPKAHVPRNFHSA